MVYFDIFYSTPVVWNNYRGFIANRAEQKHKKNYTRSVWFIKEKRIKASRFLYGNNYVDACAGSILCRRFYQKNAADMQIKSESIDRFISDFYKSSFSDMSLPEASIAYGSADSKIKIAIFTDFMCSACGKSHEVINRLIKKYPKDIYIQYYLYPLDSQCNKDIRITLYKNSCMLSKYMIMASIEGMYPETETYYYDKNSIIRNSFKRGDYSLLKEFFSSRGRIIRPDIEREAREIISRDVKLAGILGIESMPVMFINGRQINGAYPYEYIDAIIKIELSE
jgi:hypothetical protein